MDKLGLEEGQVIEHPWVSGSIEIAQRRVEQHNFEIRKQLLEYDNVMNKQREIIYGQRLQILEGFSLKENIIEIIPRLVDDYSKIYDHGDSSGIDITGLINSIVLNFGLQLDPQVFMNQSAQELKDRLTGLMLEAYENKEKAIDPQLLRNLERMVFLQIIDSKWKDHLYAMDSLREGIGLRAYGQRDPLIEYKREAFGMFSQMIGAIEEDAVQTIFSSVPKEFSHPEADKFQASSSGENAPEFAALPKEPAAKPTQSQHPKVGRNDPCPCGSHKKYKKCCGK
jgi:preprotein translocase subunit SecA